MGVSFGIGLFPTGEVNQLRSPLLGSIASVKALLRKCSIHNFLSNGCAWHTLIRYIMVDWCWRPRQSQYNDGTRLKKIKAGENWIFERRQHGRLLFLGVLDFASKLEQDVDMLLHSACTSAWTLSTRKSGYCSKNGPRNVDSEAQSCLMRAFAAHFFSSRW